MQIRFEYTFFVKNIQNVQLLQPSSSSSTKKNLLIFTFKRRTTFAITGLLFHYTSFILSHIANSIPDLYLQLDILFVTFMNKITRDMTLSSEHSGDTTDDAYTKSHNK